MATLPICLSDRCYQLPRKFHSVVGPPPSPPPSPASFSWACWYTIHYLSAGKRALQKKHKELPSVKSALLRLKAKHNDLKWYGNNETQRKVDEIKSGGFYPLRRYPSETFHFSIDYTFKTRLFQTFRAICDSKMSVCNCQITGFESALVCGQITVYSVPRISA